jgi:hypothetical protein
MLNLNKAVVPLQAMKAYRGSRGLSSYKYLTLWRLTTYIYKSYRTANLQTLHFKYLLNKYSSSSFSFGVLQLMLPEALQPYGLLYYLHIGHSNFLHQFRAATPPQQRKLKL